MSITWRPVPDLLVRVVDVLGMDHLDLWPDIVLAQKSSISLHSAISESATLRHMKATCGLDIPVLERSFPAAVDHAAHAYHADHRVPSHGRSELGDASEDLIDSARPFVEADWLQGFPDFSAQNRLAFLVG